MFVHSGQGCAGEGGSESREECLLVHFLPVELEAAMQAPHAFSSDRGPRRTFLWFQVPLRPLLSYLCFSHTLDLHVVKVTARLLVSLETKTVGQGGRRAELTPAAVCKCRQTC